MYEQFFPKWSDYYNDILQQNCSSELRQYQTTHHNTACVDTALCMMENSVKNVESQTASTGVLLGLMPTLLLILGSSPVDISLLSTRRPLLSLLLTLGAPVVNPIGLFDLTEPWEILRTSPRSTNTAGNTNTAGSTNTAGKNKQLARIIVVLQYVFALAAVVNIIILAFELYTKAYSVVTSCRWRSHIFGWTFAPAALHSMGLLVFKLRARFTPPPGLPSTPPPGKPLHLQLRATLERWADNEFSRCKQHEKREFHWDSENHKYLCWCITQTIAVGVVAQIIYGTAILSGYQFVQPLNASLLILRYFLSTWVCRVILISELSGLVTQTEVVWVNVYQTQTVDQYSVDQWLLFLEVARQ